MYQAIYVNRRMEIVHLWDDKYGKLEFPLDSIRFAYRRKEGGEFKSLYGDELEEISHYQDGDPTLFESDVPIELKILSKLYEDSDDPSEGHRIGILDIEVDSTGGFPNVETGDKIITAIALYDSISESFISYILDPERKIKSKKFETKLKDSDTVTYKCELKSFSDEISLLKDFLKQWKEFNFTIISAWNGMYFDFPYLFSRINAVLGRKYANKLSPINICYLNSFTKTLVIGGISCLDYLDLYKKFIGKDQPSFALGYIGKEEVGIEKIQYRGSLVTLYKEDLNKYIEYNLTDVKIIVALDKKLDFIHLARSVCHKGHVPYEWYMHSSRWIDGAILTYLHRKSLIAPNKPEGGKEDYIALKKGEDEGFTGAFVKDPEPGLYDWVYSADITSLYPSTIMTLNISPEKKIGKIENWDTEEFAGGNIGNVNLNGQLYSENDFKEMIKDGKVSISSNGVLYDLSKQGVIPSILDLWFSERMEFKRLAEEYKTTGDKEKESFYDRRQKRQKIFLNCFSPDHKVMTKGGLKWISDIKVGEHVYSLNRETGETEIKPVVRVYEYDYSGDMVKFEGHYFDFFVTPNHRFWLSKIGKKKYAPFKWENAGEIAGDKVRRKFPAIKPFPHENDLSMIRTGKSPVLKKEHKTILPYNGKVYCIEVEDNHTILCGRNDKYQWCGQSVYGTLGLPGFRFYDRDNAEATTVSGQHIIKMTAKYVNLVYKEKFKNKGIDIDKDFVIYIDTDSTYMSALPLMELESSFPEDPIKYTIDLSEEISSGINEFYEYVIPKMFNVNVHRIKITPDVIASAAFWVKKKRYAMMKVYDMEKHRMVLNSDNSVGKLEVKGIDVVRTSFPAKFRKFSSELLTMILNKKNKNEISSRILKMETEIMKLPVEEVSKNTSVTFISAKGDANYNPPKRKLFTIPTLKTPPQVGAALMYNDLLKKFGLIKQFESIHSGQKIKWIYLKENPFALKYLALKADGTDPDEILEYINKYADRKMMYEKELKTKILKFYNILKWNYPTVSSSIAENFFSVLK
jgi:DNA polymerase elongation subunit (family B)